MGDLVAAKVLKASIGRICEGEGVNYVQQSAFNTLMHLVVDHITKVSSDARDSAESSGRTVVNVADTAIALLDQGEDLTGLLTFLEDSRTKPKLKPLNHVPRFPLYPAVLTPNVADTLEPPKPLPNFIPPFLPALPPEHTYKHSDVIITRNESSIDNVKRSLESTIAGDLLLREG